MRRGTYLLGNTLEIDAKIALTKKIHRPFGLASIDAKINW